MKVIVDENLSPALANALEALFVNQHEITHMRTKFGTSVKDVDWIQSLSKDGRWIVISGDRRITRNRVEQAAFRNSNLIGFFLSKGLYKSSIIKQMQRILALWQVIEIQSQTVSGGAMFELPTTSTRISQLKVS